MWRSHRAVLSERRRRLRHSRPSLVTKAAHGNLRSVRPLLSLQVGNGHRSALNPMCETCDAGIAEFSTFTRRIKLTLKKLSPGIFCLALLGTAFMPSANADERDRKTTITFSAPVEIPGVHLQG